MKRPQKAVRAAVFVVLSAALAGCSSSGKKPEGVRDGMVTGLRMCKGGLDNPFVWLCIPVGLVGGAIYGAVASAPQDRTYESPVTPRQLDSRLVAKLDPQARLPGAELHIAQGQASQQADGSVFVSAWIMPNYDEPTKNAERSYLTGVTMNCATGEIAVRWWATYESQGANGQQIERSYNSPGIMEPGTAVYAATASALCSAPKVAQK